MTSTIPFVATHGAMPPTAWPDLITQEGVRGAEADKGSARITATHDVMQDGADISHLTVAERKVRADQRLTLKPAPSGGAVAVCGVPPRHSKIK